MEIVCAPETYRRFESSSLRQKRDMPVGISLFCCTQMIEEDSRVEPFCESKMLCLADYDYTKPVGKVGN